MSEPVGLIAGGGRLPFLVAQGIHRAGREVACVGVATHYDDTLPACCDQFASISVLRMASMCRRLRRWGATQRCPSRPERLCTGRGLLGSGIFRLLRRAGLGGLESFCHAAHQAQNLFT